MSGKTVLITGANGGIGKVTATELARQGCSVVLACRPSDKTNAAVDEIRQSSGVDPAKVTCMDLDLASFDSVRSLAANFQEKHDRLDVLINNAGLFPTKLQMTAEGYEMQFGVHHLAHFLLTHLLLDLLKKSAPSRVVTVSSHLHLKGHIDFDNLKGEKKYNGSASYNQSKLANVLFAMTLARRLDGSGVTSNVLHPGAVRTDITRGMPWLVRKIINMIFIPVEEGAKTSITLASDPSLATVSGKYFNQGKLSDCLDDPILGEQLWAYSEVATGIKPAL